MEGEIHEGKEEKEKAMENVEGLEEVVLVEKKKGFNAGRLSPSFQHQRP